MSIAASPQVMEWVREHIPESIIEGMIKDGFLKPEVEKNE